MTQESPTKATDLQECIDSCQTCSRICNEAVVYSLEAGGRYADASNIQLFLDCAEVCRTAINFMSRASERHGEICRACASICDRCASLCLQLSGQKILPHGTGLMETCAEACRECAEMCRQMSA